MKGNKKIFLFILIVIVILLVINFFSNKNKKNTELSENLNIPTSEMLSTIDSTVLVDLKPIDQKKKIILVIKNIPLKTKSIEYIITYETKDGGFQGINSSVPVDGSSFEKEIILGTCSSGTCVYHQIKGSIKLELVFKGDYGKRYFNKEYSF